MLPTLAFSNQHIDVSIRFFELLRKATGLFSTDRCRPPVRPLDTVQRHEAARLVRSVLALEARLATSNLKYPP